MNTPNDGIVLPFVKMTGAGNDFVLIDNRRGEFTIDWRKFAPSVCNRRYGIGADGLLVLESSTEADFTMLYFNADGSFGGMCGNGGRCASRYVLLEKKIDRVTFKALDYLYSAQTQGCHISLTMKDPRALRMNVTIDVLGQAVKLHYVDTGSPHVVLYIDELPEPLQSEIITKGIHEIGRAIRLHSEFSPEGANVNFIRILDDHSVSMRTYERGVEEETLACGTGAVACSVIAHMHQGLASPIQVRTRSNETLTVSFSSNAGLLTNITLDGSAMITFRGEFHFRLPDTNIRR